MGQTLAGPSLSGTGSAGRQTRSVRTDLLNIDTTVSRRGQHFVHSLAGCDCQLVPSRLIASGDLSRGPVYPSLHLTTPVDTGRRERQPRLWFCCFVVRWSCFAWQFHDSKLAKLWNTDSCQPISVIWPDCCLVEIRRLDPVLSLSFG